MTPEPPTFEALGRKKTVLLTSFRRDGTPVGTPVNIAVGDGRAYFRTYDKAWKVKRIRNNPQVTVAPSTIRGSSTGPAIDATARLLGGEEAERARRLLTKKYRIIHGALVPLAHKLRRYQTFHYELTPRR